METRTAEFAEWLEQTLAKRNCKVTVTFSHQRGSNFLIYVVEYKSYTFRYYLQTKGFTEYTFEDNPPIQNLVDEIFSDYHKEDGEPEPKSWKLWWERLFL